MQWMINDKRVMGAYTLISVPFDILPASGAAVPNEIRLLPWGEVDSSNGRMVVNEETAKLLVEAFQQHGTDLPIDYEHQTLGGEHASPSGQAPAAGWIKRIIVKPNDGIYAQVDWTAKAAERLAAREYRYLSPVPMVRKADRVVVRLHSAALTNKPAIVGMEPLVNAESDLAAADQVFEELQWFLKLPTTATKGEIMTELERLLAQLRELAGAPPTADQAAVLKALTDKLSAGSASDKLLAMVGKALAVDPADGKALESKLTMLAKPPAHSDEEVTRLVNRVNELEADKRRREAEDLVAQAFQAGKLTDPQRAWAVDLAGKDPEQFKLFIASAPVVVQPGKTTPPGGGATPTRELVISKTAREWDEHAELQIAGKVAVINDALKAAKLPALSPEERKQHASAAA